jgi:hypothetical protein
MANGFGAVQKRHSKWRVPKHLGAEIGFFSVLRIWNQKLQLPHVHCVVATGWISLDQTRWIRCYAGVSLSGYLF